LPMPALTALMTQRTSRHMIVVTGVTEQSVWLFDPAIGDRHMSRDEFAAQFAGDLIVFQRLSR
ncbi:MAG: cysteine peptidase family C39 domain-containing protein, partial [Planctomycetota bacterium]